MKLTLHNFSETNTSKGNASSGYTDYDISINRMSRRDSKIGRISKKIIDYHYSTNSKESNSSIHTGSSVTKSSNKLDNNLNSKSNIIDEIPLNNPDNKSNVINETPENIQNSKLNIIDEIPENNSNNKSNNEN